MHDTIAPVTRPFQRQTLLAEFKTSLLHRLGVLVDSRTPWDIIMLDCNANAGRNYGSETARSAPLHHAFGDMLFEYMLWAGVWIRTLCALCATVCMRSRRTVLLDAGGCTKNRTACNSRGPQGTLY